MADHMPMIDEDWEEWDPSKGSFVHHMIAGSAAGVMEHVAMFPLDTYKTFLQTSAKSSNPPSFAALLKQHGFARLWRGAPAMLTACIPSHTAYFTVYEVAKDAFGVNSPGHHVVGAAAAGACATVMHDAIITPMDLVKQRLQLGYYSGVWDCLTSVTRSEGLSALWRAFPTTLVMNIPYASVVVATNESMKEVLNPGGQHDM
ncbi:mcfF, partial [Symbiodinium sp. KB8]